MTREVKDILKSLMSDHQNNWHIDLLSRWDTIIGPLNTKVFIEKIQDDTLILGVTNSCWMQELYMLSSLLITTINKNLDQPRIKHLRFKGSVMKKNGISVRKAPIRKTKPPRALTPFEQAALESIQDAELRAALTAFLMRCHQESL